MEIPPWPCCCAEKVRLWDSCSPASTWPSPKPTTKTSSPTRSTHRPQTRNVHRSSTPVKMPPPDAYDCGTQRKKQSERANSDDRFRGDGVRRDDSHYSFQSEIGKQTTESATGERQRETFNQQLTYQTKAACAQGGADPKFFFSRRGASEEEVGDIAASDEEQDRDGGH